MDPVSVFSIAATAVAIVLSIGASIQNLKLLKEKLGLAASIVDTLVRRLIVIRICLNSLAGWERRRNTSRPYSSEFSAALYLSLQGCSFILQCLDDCVRKFYDQSGETSVLHKSRYLRHEDLLKEYLDNLNNEIQALQLLLACHQTYVVMNELKRSG